MSKKKESKFNKDIRIMQEVNEMDKEKAESKDKQNKLAEKREEEKKLSKAVEQAFDKD